MQPPQIPGPSRYFSSVHRFSDGQEFNRIPANKETAENKCKERIKNTLRKATRKWCISLLLNPPQTEKGPAVQKLLESLFGFGKGRRRKCQDHDGRKVEKR